MSKEALIKFALLVGAVIVGNLATTYVAAMLPKPTTTTTA